MKYDSIIFDWDGTLAKTLHLWLASYRNELERRNLSLSDQTIVDDFFYNHKRTQKLYPDINMGEFVPRVISFFQEHLVDLELYEGACATLEELARRGVRLVLVTSSSRETLLKGMGALDRDDYFEFSVTSDEVMNHKPHPEPFEEIIKAAGLVSKRTLVIGDSDTDIQAAHAAGVDSCLYTPTENGFFYDLNKLRESRPTHEVSRLADLLPLIS